MNDSALPASAARQLFGVAAYDLPTLDKIPILREMLADPGQGMALDIGIGTGCTTHALFAGRRTACIDLHAPNLAYFRARVALLPDALPPLCVGAAAAALPFRNDSFQLVLCSEVLEHLYDDDAAVGEIARVLAPQGKAVITVPYTGLGFTSFLELCGIKTVHDFPGPEQHVRPGYSEASLAALLARHGLRIERHTYYLRFFTRVVVDLVSILHLLYQRVIHGRRSWTWSEAAAAEGGLAFRVYAGIFPMLRGISRLDALLSGRRGFGLIALVRRSDGAPPR